MKKQAWAFPTESFQQERGRKEKAKAKSFAKWMGIVKGGPGSGNYGHCGGEGGAGNPGGSKPAGECGVQQEVPEFAESSRDLRKLKEDEDWSDSTGKRKVTVFHFSKEDRSESGLKRKFAGTAAAGEERQSMEYESGKLKEDSAVIHAYLFGATREKIVPGKVMHRIEAEMNVLDVGSSKYKEILDESEIIASQTGRPKLAVAREMAIKRGYDALVSQRHGIMQILRDVKPSEISTESEASGIAYEIKPSESVKKEAVERIRKRIASAARGSEITDHFTLRRAVDDMYLWKMIDSEQKNSLIGLPGSLLPAFSSAEEVRKIRDRILAAIPENADKEKSDAIRSLLKYGLLSGKTTQQIEGELLEQAKDMLSKRTPMIRVPFDVASKIWSDERFKNQFETNTSGGALNPEYRTSTEKKLIGIPESLSGKDRPVYGYAGTESGSFDNENLRHYGDVAFVLKDSVKRRSTVTFGDSLDSSLGVSNYESPELHSIASTEPGEQYETSFPYIEVQYHGGVGLNDVKKILLSERRFAMIARDMLNGNKTPKFFKDARDNNLEIEIAGSSSSVPLQRIISSVEEMKMFFWDKSNRESWQDSDFEDVIKRLKGTR